MSKLVKREDFPNMIELWFTDDEKIGTFQTLQCDVHGDGWSFTDKSGSDHCIECIKEMCEPKTDYIMPGFEDLPDRLAKLNIRARD